MFQADILAAWAVKQSQLRARATRPTQAGAGPSSASAPLVPTANLLEFRPVCANILAITLAPLFGEFIHVAMSRCFISQPPFAG